MNSQFAPMTLGDIFENTFSLIGKTFVRNLFIALLLLAVPMILMTIAADDFYSSIADMQDAMLHGHAETGFDAILSLLGTISFFGFATLVFAIGVLFAEIAISVLVSQEMMSHPITFWDAIGETFNLKWLYGIGQAILKYSIIIGAVLLVGVTIAILASESKLLSVLIVVLFVLILIPAVLYLVFKWYFSLTAVAVDDMSVIESLRQSWQLVEGHWWRTFGILILLSILSQFVISIVSLPITFGSMWDVYKEFFTMLGKTGGNINPEAFKELEKSFGPGIAIGSGISALLSLLMAPVYTVVMYYDLRARKNPVLKVQQQADVAQDVPPEPIDFGQM